MQNLFENIIPYFIYKLFDKQQYSINTFINNSIKQKKYRDVEKYGDAKNYFWFIVVLCNKISNRNNI